MFGAIHASTGAIVILKRFYDDDLAQAAYLIGCSATGEALVVDPNRDIEVLVEAANEEGLRITHVAETHIHADFVSGARQLASTTGALLHLSGEGGPDWSYRFAEGDGADLLADGDRFQVGEVRVDVRHTPGHTPEHVSLVITDTAAADRPMGVLSGDFIFAGDVGRPDLLERAGGASGTMEEAARQLFRSLRGFAAEYPDYLQIWPGHGAGSACGKSLGAVPQTTLGYEKLFNWAFQHAGEDEFVKAALAGQPEPPMYFAEMKRINRDGPPIETPTLPASLPDERLNESISEGVAIVDTRPRPAYESASVPGSYHLPYDSRAFLTWAGSVLPLDREIHLIAEDDRVGEITRKLRLIGIERIDGAFSPGAVSRWLRDHPETPAAVATEEAGNLESELGSGEAGVIDVRTAEEWRKGHIPGSTNAPIGRLTERLDEIPASGPLVVHCQSGARAMVAIAALRAHGFADVRHLEGDFAGWVKASRPVEIAGPPG